jgi:hypothetical protein
MSRRVEERGQSRRLVGDEAEPHEAGALTDIIHQQIEVNFEPPVHT